MEEKSELSRALGEGDPEKVAKLLSEGAALGYVREGGYDALLDVVYGRDLSRDPRLLDLLRLLIARGASLNGVSVHRESALFRLSSTGRFDAVRLLLEAGADETRLAWTPLIRAIALGSLAEVDALVAAGAPLEDVDGAKRTAWLVALLAGDLEKARRLLDGGANELACGPSGEPPLFYAIDGHHPDLVRWLLERGHDVEWKDRSGTTALKQAIEHDDLGCVDVLLAAGADLGRGMFDSALSEARSSEIARRLLDAGADPADLSRDGARALLGFDPDDEDYDPGLIDATEDDYRRGGAPRFGITNPERIHEPFWEAMIRAGVGAYAAKKRFDNEELHGLGPIWCAHRFGQSLTFLSDDRIVQIGGEHEDFSDPDFCIYNDVFVHGPGGALAIYGYPKADFPPTDFHTATLSGSRLYVIGSVGYQGTRRFGETPVYRLDLDTMHMERLAADGDGPGWIGRHRADLVAPDEIRVSGGRIARLVDGKETFVDNSDVFVLDIERLRWRRETPPQDR
jgi:ankyrin repeat protein